MESQLFEQIQQITKAHAYDVMSQRTRELIEIRDLLIEALKLAMRQLEDPDEDINAIRDNAAWTIERARRI